MQEINTTNITNLFENHVDFHLYCMDLFHTNKSCNSISEALTTIGSFFAASLNLLPYSVYSLITGEKNFLRERTQSIFKDIITKEFETPDIQELFSKESTSTSPELTSQELESLCVTIQRAIIRKHLYQEDPHSTFQTTVKALLKKHALNDISSLYPTAFFENFKKTHTLSQNAPLKVEEIKAHLDKYVIGQDDAKEKLIMAAYLHHKKICSLRAGTKTEQTASKSNMLLMGPSGSGKTLLLTHIAEYLKVPFIHVDATQIIGSGYVGGIHPSDIIQFLFEKAHYDVARTEIGIVFIDEIDKKAEKPTSSGSLDVTGSLVQTELLKIVEGTTVKVSGTGNSLAIQPKKTIDIQTKNIFFIAGGAFVNLNAIVQRRLNASTSSNLLSKATQEDLIRFGLIPEFVGRFSSITCCTPLKKEDLLKILTDPKDAVIPYYQQQFQEHGVALTFTSEALDAIAQKAQLQQTGARALRTIVESLNIGNLLYSVLKDNTIQSIIITKECVTSNEPPKIEHSLPKGKI